MELKLSERPWREEACCPASGDGGAGSGEDTTETVTALRALADGIRLRIVRMLAAHQEPLCVCHIVDAFELSQPTISHHLKALREAGLVSVEKRGLWAYYELKRERLGKISEQLLGACC